MFAQLPMYQQKGAAALNAKLDKTLHFAAHLGNPEDQFKSIHVAGTNGKGSIASGIASILKASGYRVGLYTSPHLVRFNERIQIDGKEISDRRVVDAYNAVRHVHYGDREPTFFEFATAMAFHEFAANVFLFFLLPQCGIYGQAPVFGFR